MTAIDTAPTPGPAGPRSPARPRGRVLPRPVSGQEIALVGVIAVLCLLLGLFTPGFLTAGSLRPLLSNVAPIAIMGVGMTFVIIAGGIDISISAMLMVSAVAVAKLLVGADISLVVALAVAIAIGGVLGLLNGVLIAVGRVHPVIITFGTANVFLFIGLRIFDSKVVNGLPPTLAPLGRGEAGRLLGIPLSFWLMAVIAAVAWWYLRYTAGGRHLYAIGSDATAARMAGIPVQRRTVFSYALTGLLVGLAAVIVIANGTQSVAPTVGRGLELQVIAAVVIGGTSIMGGRGSVLGTVLGAILVQIVTSGVIQLGWPSQLANAFVGLSIIIAVGADLLQQRLRRKA